MKDKTQAYIENKGWSSHKFASLLPSFQNKMKAIDAEITIGRTVCHIKKNEKTLKLYPHYKGQSNDTLTLVDADGEVLLDFTLTISFEELIETITANLC